MSYYKCLSEKCKDHDLRYSERWVQTPTASGKDSMLCLCGATLQLIDEEEKTRKTPALNTRDCGPASNPFTH